MAVPAHELQAPVFNAEKMAWPQFAASFAANFKQGDHVTILGPPESGKTHLAVLITEMRALSFFLALKPRDPLIGRLHARGWTVSSSLDPAKQTVERERVVDGKKVKEIFPLYPRFVFWPFPIPAERATLDLQADAKRAAAQASMIFLQRQGSWSVVWDEAMYMTDTLRLRREMSEFWTGARSNKISVITVSQRPSWIPKTALTGPHHLFIFQASEREDLKRLGEISGGMDWRPIAETIGRLDWRAHEFLYVAPHDRRAIVSAAPAW